jgi:hypothetical protein
VQYPSYEEINMRRLRLGMARINATVGGFKGNTRKILKFADGSAFGG